MHLNKTLSALCILDESEMQGHCALFVINVRYQKLTKCLPESAFRILVTSTYQVLHLANN